MNTPLRNDREAPPARAGWRSRKVWQQMLELSPKKLIERVGKPSYHSRDWSTDSSSDGLLSPTGSPGRSRWRRSKSAWYRPRRSIWLSVTLSTIAVFALWTFLGRRHELLDDGGLIPNGESRYREGREVFWWEQFPRYARRSMHITPC